MFLFGVYCFIYHLVEAIFGVDINNLLLEIGNLPEELPITLLVYQNAYFK